MRVWIKGKLFGVVGRIIVLWEFERWCEMRGESGGGVKDECLRRGYNEMCCTWAAAAVAILMDVWGVFGGSQSGEHENVDV